MRGYLARLIDGLEPWAADRRMANFLAAEGGRHAGRAQGRLRRGALLTGSPGSRRPTTRTTPSA